MSAQGDLETSLLLMLYEESGQSGQRLKAREIAMRLRPPVGETRVALGLQHLQQEGLVSGSFDNFNASGFAITRKGLLSVESEFDYLDTEGRPEFRPKVSLIVPASDRLVALDHNAPDYLEVVTILGEVAEAVRGYNGSDLDPSARERVVASLGAAETLWNAAELRIIQIKVGVLMAAEDAAQVLANTAKAVASALLVDIIKAFVKNHFGVDLDKI